MPLALLFSFSGPAPARLPGRRLTLPAPGGDPALREVAGHFAAERSDEPWVVVDPSDGGFHVLSPTAALPLDAPGPARPPALARAAWEAAKLPLRAVDAVRHPGRALGGVLAAGERAAGAATAALWPRPDTPYDEDGAAQVRVTWLRLEAERIAPLAEGPGGVDGLLASAVGRALRDDLDRLGHDGEARDANRLAAEVLSDVTAAPATARVAGRAPKRLRPLPFPAAGLALGVAALRDDGGVTVGVAADPGVLDPDVLAGELDAAVGELLDAVGAAPPPPPPAPPPPAPQAAEPEPLPGQPEARVETPTELVGEFADPGAEDGAGARVQVAEPWEGYGAMTAQEIVDRLAVATGEELAVVAMYERRHRDRRTVLDAAQRALSRR